MNGILGVGTRHTDQADKQRYDPSVRHLSRSEKDFRNG